MRPAWAQPQSDTRQRQAAAEAYDQGTAAYLSGDYEKAAEWFETANRMSPAAPALIQAARAHEQAGHLARAASLALRLTTEYPNEAAAVQFAQGMLGQLAGKFLRVDVVCDGCAIDVDGTLQESQSFFVEPDTTHEVTASFETGERKAEVTGHAGETQSLEFEAPPRPPTPIETSTPVETGTEGIRDVQVKPLPPLATFIGAGVTAGLLGASIWSRLDTNSGVGPYEDAAKAWQDCAQHMGKDNATCVSLRSQALKKLDNGQGKETRTTVLWIATGASAAATGAIALFLTDWSGHKDDDKAARRMNLSVAPARGGATLWLKGTF